MIFWKSYFRFGIIYALVSTHQSLILKRFSYRYHHFKLLANKIRPLLLKQSKLSIIISQNIMETCIDTSQHQADTYTSIKKEMFVSTIHLLALRIPSKSCDKVMKLFQNFLFNRPKFKRIYNIPNDEEQQEQTDMRHLLLSESIKNIEDMNAVISIECQQYITSNELSIEDFKLDLGYEHMSVEEVLKKLLPTSIKDIPSAFEQIGHVAHINLRDDVLSFKYLIGQAILDKNPNIKTVVNKIGQIETEYRTFPMEVIAGEDNLDVVLKESGARFKFNFRTVYWNSRLQMEHSRLIHMIKQEEAAVVADMMAGVGPFAIPLSMSRVSVHANDLNPESYRYLVENAKANHCKHSLHCYNLDGRDFILQLLSKKVVFTEAIMNLPQNATDFLDVFIGLNTRLKTQGLGSFADLPRIHCYAFSTSETPILDIASRVAGVLQCEVADLNYTDTTIATGIAGNSRDRSSCWGHIVRDVSPKKVMVCLTFRLPSKVAEAEPVTVSTIADVLTSSEPLNKRKKLHEVDDVDSSCISAENEGSKRIRQIEESVDM